MGNIGTVCENRDEFSRALEYYERELAIATEIGNRRESQFAIGNLGNIHLLEGDYLAALAAYAKTLDSAAEMGDQQTLVVAALNMSDTYRVQGDYVRALTCYGYALNGAIELNDRMVSMVSLGYIAQIYMEQGRYDQAEALFAKASALAESLNIPYFLCEHRYGKADLDSRRKHYADAQSANDEALRIATQVERKDIHVRAQLLANDLELVLD